MVSVGTCQSRGPDTAQSQGPQQPIRMIGKSHGVAPGTEGVSAGKSVYWREGGGGGGNGGKCRSYDEGNWDRRPRG